MEQTEILIHFNRHFKSKNFMTPDTIGHRSKGNIICEISKGTGIENETIYGVTFLEVNEYNSTNRPENDQSGCCNSKKEVEELINKVFKN